jgi:hypothetical protein
MVEDVAESLSLDCCIAGGVACIHSWSAFMAALHRADEIKCVRRRFGVWAKPACRSWVISSRRWPSEKVPLRATPSPARDVHAAGCGTVNVPIEWSAVAMCVALWWESISFSRKQLDQR